MAVGAVHARGGRRGRPRGRTDPPSGSPGPPQRENDIWMGIRRVQCELLYLAIAALRLIRHQFVGHLEGTLGGCIRVGLLVYYCHETKAVRSRYSSRLRR